LFWIIKEMDLRVAEPLGLGAPFGSDTLIPGLPDEIVVSILWPKMAAHLYFLNGSTSEAEVHNIV
jgi:anti-sigma factor RsiW